MYTIVYNMVSTEKFEVDVFQKGIQCTLEELRTEYQILKAIEMMKRDVLPVLPTGFGNKVWVLSSISCEMTPIPNMQLSL